MLRQQNIIRNAIKKDIGTYTKFEENCNFENGVITYLNNTAFGDMRELLNDIGISVLTNPYSNAEEYLEAREDFNLDSDIQWQNFEYARLPMIDMTDYETDWAGPNEID